MISFLKNISDSTTKILKDIFSILLGSGLFGFLIPSFFVLLTILFILIHVNVICINDFLSLFMIYPETKHYSEVYFIMDSSVNFIGYFIDTMFDIIEITISAITDGEFKFKSISFGGKCNTT